MPAERSVCMETAAGNIEKAKRQWGKKAKDGNESTADSMHAKAGGRD